MSSVSTKRHFIAEASPDLMTSLRVGTRPQHEALEDALQLLQQPLSRERFLKTIRRFFGFHRVFEPALAAHEFLRAFHIPRCRLPLLRGDLLGLGETEAAIEALPLCDNAQRLTHRNEHALGALYVLEGSTLGGQIITRALADASWAPAGGLRSFNPYGDETGRMWKDFRAFAEAQGGSLDHSETVKGAQNCFGLLRDWLAS